MIASATHVVVFDLETGAPKWRGPLSELFVEHPDLDQVFAKVTKDLARGEPAIVGPLGVRLPQASDVASSEVA